MCRGTASIGLLVAVFAVGPIVAIQADPLPLLPKQARVEGLLSPAEFFRFPVGDRHLRHHEVVDYFEYLADESDRAVVIRYGRSHGRRPLLVLVVSSPEQIKLLDAIRAARPTIMSGRAEADDTPLVMYLGYGVHGDEASAMNAAPVVAWHLVSSIDDGVREQLSKGVFLIDPALNPDGNDRFANWANENRGRFASNSMYDREHNQPWPGGRTNYYWFDLNRDWLPATHPESRGRLALFHRWKPNVVLDFHEMGSSSTYFFQPGIPERNNPLSPPRNLELTREFAKRHAEAMDRVGELYFTEERYDDFYPGKGSTYPDLHGSVGILFEQGSSRGKRIKVGPVARDFRDSVANQVRTSLSSLLAASTLKKELIEYQAGFYADARVQAAEDGVKAYVLTGTATRIAAAATLLNRHAIRSYRPDSAVTVAGQPRVRTDVLIVPTDQPEYVFLKSLMTPLQSFRENLFYDVSTWHLPSAMDLDCIEHRSDVPEGWLGASSAVDSGSAGRNKAAVSLAGAIGVVFSPLELGAPKLVARLMRMGARVSVVPEQMAAEGDDGESYWPPGSYLLLRQHNSERWGRLMERLPQAANRLGVSWNALDTSVTVTGPDLGSSSMLKLPKCQPLLVVGAGTNSYSAGSLWHLLDVRLGLPSVLADASDLGRTGLLDDKTCVILPSGSYSSASQSDVESLEEYVKEGGTVVAVASAIRWLGRKELISLQDAKADESAEQQSGDTPSPGLPPYAEASDRRALERIAGAFLSAETDPTHPLAYGFPDSRVPVFRDHSYRFLLPDNPYQVAARYSGVIAGYVSDRNRERLKNSAAVWVEPSGRGRYILLADEPAFRGYVRSSERFLTNALLLGPVLRTPPPPIERD